MDSSRIIPNHRLGQYKCDLILRADQPEKSLELISSFHIDGPQTSKEVIERLKLVLGASSERELSTMLGYGATGMTNKRQRGSVPYEDAHRVALALGVSLDWLIAGKGEPPAIAPVQVALQQIAEAPMAYSHLSGSEIVEIPLYDIEAAAGHGRVFDEEKIVGHLPYRADELVREGLIAEQLVALRVKGDSMVPTLDDGDLVVVNRANRQPDGVFVVRVGEDLRIKRVQKMMAGCLRLSSDNDHYAPEVISPDQVDGFEIIGSVYSRSGRVF